MREPREGVPAKTMQNILLILLIASLIIVMTPAAAVWGDDGTIWDPDENFKWGYKLVEENGVFHAEIQGYSAHFPEGVQPSGKLELVIPEEIDGYPVTGIADRAFDYTAPFICEGAEIYLTIPGHIKRIGENAFQGTPNIRQVNIESGVETIGEGAFSSSGVVKVILPQGLKRISRETFKYCRQLEEIIIPDTIEWIEERAFYSCPALKDVYLPDTLTGMGGEAFELWRDLIIHARAGTWAAGWAEGEGIPFVEEGCTVLTVEQNISGKSRLIAYVGNRRYVPITRKARYRYKSMNKSVAVVSSSGRVVFKGVGRTKIRVTAPAYTSTTTDGRYTIVRKYKEATKTIIVTSRLSRPGLSVKSKKGKKASIIWSKVKGAAGYKLYIKFPGRSGFKCVLTKSATVKGVTHRGLTAGKKYKYKVRAFKKKNGKMWYSDFSKVRTITVRK